MLLYLLTLMPMAGACLGRLLFPSDRPGFLTLCRVLAAAELAAALAAALAAPDGMLALLPGPAVLPLSLTVDGFRRIYAVIIAFMWLLTLLLSGDYFAGHERIGRYLFFTMMTLGATMGVFLANDLMTAFVFFEIMSFTSFPWVIQEETDGAVRAAGTYLAIAVIGGLTALMGLFLLQHTFGTLQLSDLQGAVYRTARPGTVYAAGLCLLIGFGAKAGMFPLHVWLPKAHPVAPAPASALLSGVLTKAGIWGVLVLCCRLFAGDAAWGAVILVTGCVTMLLGAVLALFSVDLKRTLACSSLSQIGFILVGCGMICLLGEESALAARGTLLHMINHSLFKLLLFMCAGVVYMNAHTLDLTKLRGFGRKKPFLMICFLLGAAGISGVPGLNGYISKTLLHESIAEGALALGSPALRAAEWIFLFSGGLTFAYMLKLFVCLFVQAPLPEAETAKAVAAKAGTGPYMGLLSRLALALAALPLPVLGFTASRTMDALADLGTDFFAAPRVTAAVSYFSWECLQGSLISLGIGAAVYLIVVRLWMIRGGVYIDRWPAKLDLEERVYRPLLLTVLPGLFGSLSRLFAENVVTARAARAFFRLGDIVSHAAADMTDGLILLLRRTLFRPNRRPDTDKVHESLSYRLGLTVDRLQGKESADMREHRHARLYYRAMHTFLQTTHELADTVSFALLMLTGAIGVILIYVLLLRG